MAKAAEMWLCFAKESEAHHSGDEDAAQFWLCVAVVAETTYAVERDGWRLFLERNGFNEPQIMVSEMRDFWLLDHMNEYARILPQAEDALRTLAKRSDSPEEIRRSADGPIKLRTVEDAAADWEECIRCCQA
jgi:hypothetical protein